MHSLATPRALALVLVCLASTTAIAAAQNLGTFRWQQAPYCNVLTLNVVQSGPIYRLDGTDDQCGASRAAAVTGLGFPNLNGTIGLGLTIVTNDGAATGGAPVHLDVVIALPSPSGTWRANTGQSGPFTLLTGPASGSPRPLPVPAFPGGLTAGGARITAVGDPSEAADAVNKGYVDTLVRTALLNEKVWSGVVSAAGAKISSGRYSATRISTGIYWVTFELAGLGIQLAFPSFNWVVSPRCPTYRSGVPSQFWISTGTTAVQQTAEVYIFDANGAPADCEFIVMAVQPDPDAPGSPFPSSSSTDGRADVSCVTGGALTSCLRRPAP